MVEFVFRAYPVQGSPVDDTGQYLFRICCSGHYQLWLLAAVSFNLSCASSFPFFAQVKHKTCRGNIDHYMYILIQRGLQCSQPED